MADGGLDQIPLVIEQKDAFLSGNGSPEEWDDLTHRPHLPGWAQLWLHAQEEDHKDRLDELFTYHMPPFTLLEVEVKDDTGIASGKALLRIDEARTSASQHVARVTFLAATETGYADWAKLHFNELKDFEVHFCRRTAPDCKLKPRVAKMGWFHVSAFRLVTMLTAASVDYMRDAAVAQFNDHLTSYMEGWRKN